LLKGIGSGFARCSCKVCHDANFDRELHFRPNPSLKTGKCQTNDGSDISHDKNFNRELHFRLNFDGGLRSRPNPVQSRAENIIPSKFEAASSTCKYHEGTLRLDIGDSQKGLMPMQRFLASNTPSIENALFVRSDNGQLSLSECTCDSAEGEILEISEEEN
jgi:hypothetical protein